MISINQNIYKNNHSEISDINSKQQLTEEKLFTYIPYDIIVLIIDIIYEPTILLTNKKLSQFIIKHKGLFLQMALQRELNNTIVPETFRQSQNYEFKIHQRIIVPGLIKDRPRGARNNFNGKIIEIKNKWAKYIRVDLYGNKIDNTIHIMQNVKLTTRGNNWHWIDSNKCTIYPGILLCDYGPQILSVDSHYLKYKFALDKYGMEPDINVIVLISYGEKCFQGLYSHYHGTIHEYVICELDTCNMRLECIEKNNEKLTPYLLANKIDNKWVIVSDDSYQIQIIGCHINGYSC